MLIFTRVKLFGFQLRGAMRATSSIVRNFALAIGAFAGLRFGSGRRGELVDLFDHDEDDKGQDQEVHDGVDEATVG